MTRLRFVLDLPDTNPYDPEEVRHRFAPLIIALEALTKIDEWHLRDAIARGQPLPRLYDSGVVYREEPPGQEDWLDYPSLLKQMWGDCEDLGCALAAERRVYDGVAAVPAIRVKFIPAQELRSSGYHPQVIPREGIYLVHVLTALPNGIVEDPSKVLGMKGAYS